MAEIKEIAIIGISGRFPGAGDLEAFWTKLVAGQGSQGGWLDEAVMRVAEERRKASAITTSAIRLSLVGAQVGWMMKTSLPRTFSLISALISPSENLPTEASPRGICS